MKKYFITLLISLALPCFGYANDTNLGRYSEAVRPIQNSSIRMESEKINVKMYNGYSTTSCKFKFINQTNKTQTVLMGFPDGTDRVSEYADGNTKITDFCTIINGRKISVNHKKGKMLKNASGGLDYPYWYSWEMSFKPGETKTIVNTYKTQNTCDSMGYTWAGYVITTGSPWAGTIKDAEIVFDISNFKVYDLCLATPSNYKFSGDKLIWHFKNFEPTTNIEVIANKELDLNNLFFESSGDINNIDLREQAKKINTYFEKKDYKNTIKEVDKLLAQGNLNLSAHNYFLTKKAAANIKLGKVKDAIPTLEKVVSSQQINLEAAYYLMNYYKSNNINKAKDIYRSNIFMKTNGVFQKWVNEQILTRGSSFFKPKLTECTIERENYLIKVQDMDGDIKNASLTAWYLENGKKKYVINESVYGSYFYPYEIGFSNCYSAAIPSNVKALYYKVTAIDYNNNKLITNVKKVNIK